VDGSTNTVFELPDHAPGEAQGDWPETSRGTLDDAAVAGGRTSPDNVAHEIQRLLNVAREALADDSAPETSSHVIDGVSDVAWPHWTPDSETQAARESAAAVAAQAAVSTITGGGLNGTTSGKRTLRVVVARMTLDARRANAFRERELTPIEAAANGDEVEIWFGTQLFARGRLQLVDCHFAIRITERIETTPPSEEVTP